MKLDLYRYVGRTGIDGTGWPAWARRALSQVCGVRHEREFNWRFKYAMITKYIYTPVLEITGLIRISQFKIIISKPE